MADAPFGRFNYSKTRPEILFTIHRDFAIVKPIRGSTMVVRLPVKEMVAGSNPARGATIFRHISYNHFV